MTGPDRPLDPGLCARCRHASVQGTRRGSDFWRCRLADTDPGFLRYPPLPVTVCEGFEAGSPSGTLEARPPEGSR